MPPLTDAPPLPANPLCRPRHPGPSFLQRPVTGSSETRHRASRRGRRHWRSVLRAPAPGAGRSWSCPLPVLRPTARLLAPAMGRRRSVAVARGRGAASAGPQATAVFPSQQESRNVKTRFESRFLPRTDRADGEFENFIHVSEGRASQRRPESPQLRAVPDSSSHSRPTDTRAQGCTCPPPPPAGGQWTQTQGGCWPHGTCPAAPCSRSPSLAAGRTATGTVRTRRWHLQVPAHGRAHLQPHTSLGDQPGSQGSMSGKTSSVRLPRSAG